MPTNDRFRVVTTAVKIADSGPGPLRLAIEAVDSRGALFSQRDRHAIITGAMRNAGLTWIQVFLPGRFRPYAAKYLGYRAKYWLRHSTAPADIQPTSGPTIFDDHPLVESGELGSRALTGAAVKVIGTGTTGNNPRIQIRIPQAHFLRAKDKAVLQRVPSHEIKAIAKKVESNIAKVVQGATLTVSRRGRRRLTPSTEL